MLEEKRGSYVVVIVTLQYGKDFSFFILTCILTLQGGRIRLAAVVVVSKANQHQQHTLPLGRLERRRRRRDTGPVDWCHCTIQEKNNKNLQTGPKTRCWTASYIQATFKQATGQSLKTLQTHRHQEAIVNFLDGICNRILVLAQHQDLETCN